MAGRGPQPKDPSRRARTNADTVPSSVIRFELAEQPELPAEMDWHSRTVEWWAMWGRSPQAEHFMESDWDFLLDTALMHNSMWAKGQWTLAAEVRLRVAKFGATPEDRNRLRMSFADADEKESKRPAAIPSSRERRGPLKGLASIHDLPPAK